MPKNDWLAPFQECEDFIKEIEENPSVLQAVYGVGETGHPRYAQHVLVDRLVDAVETVCFNRGKIPYSIDVEAWRELPEMQKTLEILHRFLFQIYQENPSEVSSSEKQEATATSFYGRLDSLCTMLIDMLPEVPVIDSLANHLVDAGLSDAPSHSLYYSLCLSMQECREDREDIIQGALEDLASDNPHVLMGTLDVLTDIQRFADLFDYENYIPKTHYKPLGRYEEFLKAAVRLTGHENADVAEIAVEAVEHLKESHARSLDDLTAGLQSPQSKLSVRRALMAVRSITTPSAG